MNDPDDTGAHQPDRAEHPEFNIAPQPPAIGRYRIERMLGRGGFGLVYLACDDELNRSVAIKVPHPHLLAQSEQVTVYITEARTVASLDHPNIVPVYDVGSTPDWPYFIVSKYIDGRTLAQQIAHGRLGFEESAELVATVAEALHYAHTQGIVHRDIKPGNILIGTSGKPFVVDFGLALKERDVGHGPRYAGTPAYMSPEQARGEGHRVDGRSDIFSLGVVFYELLIGRRPFKADTQADLLEQIAAFDPRPLRQYDETIPKELERVCFKALSKRASDRYSTAKDLADDLRHFLAQRSGSVPRGTSSSTVTPVVHTPVPVSVPSTPLTPASPISDSQPMKIVPKGLRSFDAHDADFFLELLPGPRDRDGLPDSLRYWKIRIEERDADNTFAMGLIYGPSGCGKSSLVKAGLLPRLSDLVIPVYVEATAEGTEARLMNGLRKRVPAVADNRSLKETLAALRRGQGVPPGKKVVVILDQFEQWLHAKKEEQNTELVQALRQCDGGRVQCIVMVRDDFWMAATRFMRELEVRIIEGQNSAAVDRFDTDHARKVLAAFGRAFSKLPENGGNLNKGQKEFVTQAVAGLAQEGKVISVRVALFAEMMKGKAWTLATLKEAGGAEGVGVTFLEETFSAATAPPEHRYHQKAARAVLSALLPEAGTDIKGHMRSHTELLGASGYSARPTDFDDLVRILDGEVRLITPTDPEGYGGVGELAPQTQQGQKYYQLTHDYLVPALRGWLTRKQKETRRGRAELLLSDRAAVWTARPENRQLPSLLQWLSIRWLTRQKSWTLPQRKMMRTAARLHGVRAAIALVGAAFLGLAGWEYHARSRAHDLRDQVLNATTAKVPDIVDEMAPHRRRLDTLLRESEAEAEASGDARKRLHIALALLPSDPSQADYLYERLLDARADEFAAICRQLTPHRERLTGRLWSELENTDNDPERRFRAACALAAYTPDDPRWATAGPFVATKLVTEPPFSLADWVTALRPAGRHLLPQIASALADETGGLARRRMAITLYREFAGVGDFSRLEVGLDASGRTGGGVEAAKERANLAVAMVQMGRSEKVWPLLVHAPDPTVRGYLIERLRPGGVAPGVIESRLKIEPDVSARRALILALGASETGPASAERLLLDLYSKDPDPGVHSAAEWTLSRWGRTGQIRAVPFAGGGRAWFLNPAGQTMAVVHPGQLRIRSSIGKEEWQNLKLDHSFAIAMKEVTVEEFRRFRKDGTVSPEAGRPAGSVSWYAAAEYCNWLSESEGLPKADWCYAPNEKGQFAEGMGVARNYLQRRGYRLPTLAEWAFAAAAGAETRWPCGNQDLLSGYAWLRPTSEANSIARTWPAGTLKPNDFGLFDVFGNVAEWCQDELTQPKPVSNGSAEFSPVKNSPARGVCGGDYGQGPAQVGTRGFPLDRTDAILGFRPVRTMVP